KWILYHKCVCSATIAGKAVTTITQSMHQGPEWYYSKGVTVQNLQRKVGTEFVGRALHTVVEG
ncbi:hypothetical protein Tco_0463598, partial [Tanacetum coccineum]